MTIDERLEKLVERHEALAQTVELSEHRMEQVRRDTQRHVEETRILISELASVVRLTNQTVVGLVRIVESHEARLDRLESK